MMTRKEIEKLMKKEGLLDWSLRITNHGSCCWHDIKQIWIDKRQLHISMVLHEVAHALLAEKERNHTYLWGDKFTKLVNKYCENKKEE